MDVICRDSKHYSIRTKTLDTIILHYVSAVNVDENNPYDIKAILKILDDYKVSAHYVIGRDGYIYSLVATNYKAWHAGKSKMPYPDNRTNVNDFSIGIELVGMAGQIFTDKQYDSLANVIKSLIIKHPFIKKENILGHEHIAGGRKIDPGIAFDWFRLHEAIYGDKKELNITPPLAKNDVITPGDNPDKKGFLQKLINIFCSQ